MAKKKKPTKVKVEVNKTCVGCDKTTPKGEVMCVDCLARVEVIDDNWWDKLEAKIAKRSWLDNSYWFCKRNIKDLYYWFLYTPRRVCQYFYRGFSDRQLWSLNWTIAKYVVPRLKRLKEIQQGYPIILWTEEGESAEGNEKAWSEIMDKMIYAFDSLAKNGDWDLPLDGLDLKDIKNGNPKYEDWKKRNSVHWERLEEGFLLFGLFIGSLWD